MDVYEDGVSLAYMELVGVQEQRDWDAVAEQHRQAYQSGNTAAIAAAEQAIQAHGARYNLPKYQNSDEYYTDAYRRIDRNGLANHTNPDVPLYRVHPVFVPYVNGKLDSRVWDQHHRFGMFEEKVDNPQGLNGRYNRYWAEGNNSGGLNHTHECDKGGPGCAMLRVGKVGDLPPVGPDQIQNGILYRNYTEEQYWAQPKPIRAHAWAPTVAVSYDLTDNSRLFVRYAQMTRFPSVYEVGSFHNDLSYIGKPKAPNFRFKPERSRSWEIGYSFNFAPYWSRLRAGDVRLTYYRNRIQNVIETTDHFRTVQYDRKDTAGLEWQSRIDTGRFFAALGATYRLKQQMCDRDTAIEFDPYGYKGVPDCIEGGYGSTRGYQAVQPKYSINLDAGVRLLGEQLELGLRGIYHSSVNTKQYDQLLQKDLGVIFRTTGKPYHWRPSLIWDVYGRYQLHKNLNVNLGITNLTNRYYLDPMSNVPAPGPGRTVTFGITGRF